MDTAGQFTWIRFYMEFADRLMEYRHDRATLVQKILKVFSDIEMRIPTLESKGVPRDIDPFTVFGLFNRGIKDENRKAFIRGIGLEFGMQVEAPEEFLGVPLVNNQKVTFYAFEGEARHEHDIDNLWETFEAALALADEENDENRARFCDAYDTVLTQFAVRWNLTMGLFWIRPYFYLSLDSRNRWYMANPANVAAEISNEVTDLSAVPSAEKYLEIRAKCAMAFSSGQCAAKSFPELSAIAWQATEEVNEQRRNAARQTEKAEKENALSDADVETVHYWVYSPGRGSTMWNEFYSNGTMRLGWPELGDLNQYNNKTEIRDQLCELRGDSSSHTNTVCAVWQFVHDLKPGDVVYAKRGHNEILGRGIVEGGYEFDDSGHELYPHVRRVKWTHKMSRRIKDGFHIKALTDITNFPSMVNEIASFFADEDSAEQGEERVVRFPSYGPEDFLREVYLSDARYKTLVGLLQNKKNVILQGAPGTGKTYLAKRLAYSMMGVKDVERVMMIQFHQSYSYEDFIMGFRPKENGFELKKGVFYSFCKRAEEDTENDYFFIIDEINRGNLSKIFGELFMLIENDKRGSKNKLQLLYSDEMFYVPSNVYIIGLMNTADRSLAMLDYALRRRFAFFDLKPAFESGGFRAYRESLGHPKLDALIRSVEELNLRIEQDESLGEGFCIGHSYFCNIDAEDLNNAKLDNIVEYELIPMLKEYWFDEPSKVKEWSDKLRKTIQ